MALALAILTALMPLIPLFIDLYQGKVSPERQRQELEEDYDRDIAEAERAVALSEPGTLARLFEMERRAQVRRGELDPRGAGTPGGVRGGPPGDQRGPDDRPAP